MYAAIKRRSRAASYQCGDVGSLGRHFSQAALEDLTSMQCVPCQVTESERCGLSQPKSSAICKNRDLAASSFEQAQMGHRTVMRVPFFTLGRWVCSIFGCWRRW